MPERGTPVQMSPLTKGVLRVVELFTSPLKPDDYISLINPLWTTEELRGRIERIHRETDDSSTVFITPGFRWPGHRPGQYVRIGFDVAGKRHWRVYSLSTGVARSDGQISVTVKHKADGVVSPYLNSSHAVGDLVTLGTVEGEFTLPANPGKLLFLTAGSGITPIRAILQWLDRADSMPDVVHVHSARRAPDQIFAEQLKGFAARHPSYQLSQRVTSEAGRLTPQQLDKVCPDWRERETYICGPGEMLDAFQAHFEAGELEEQLHVESFEHIVLGKITGAGGTVEFAASGVEAKCDGQTPILVAGEQAGLTLPFGCRMGICHTCVGRLAAGTVRDLRTGDLTHAGTEVRTCVNCADGPITIEL